MTDTPERIFSWQTYDKDGQRGGGWCTHTKNGHEYILKEAADRERDAAVDAALERVAKMAENRSAIYTEDKPDDWEDTADNMLHGFALEVRAMIPDGGRAALKEREGE